MRQIEIPGSGVLQLRYLLLDFNGTIATDGKLIEGVAPRLEALARDLEIHVLTADTFGTARQATASLPVRLTAVRGVGGGEDKARVVRDLGAAHVAVIGNGFNDVAMLREAALGIVVIGAEGASAAALAAARVVALRIEDALDLLLHPRRLVATLRT
ncbi:ATPase P [Caldinitratiruptor microaerophilus]|uniref:ATPase P n=1 Tax=Caldinitratiruptor microaerophilus TaxID=671077 RepID=A0AA35GA43_9FIRM|nr:ATPase P [Caldinitratiruptor microaerophilus]BDG60919.1 hypothetical protein caldi_20090 [Caldinitratiruptor microaerophilus]